MRVVALDAFGDAETLRVIERPNPALGEGRVALVRVHASFVSAKDVQIRSGSHPYFRNLISLPQILGGEFVGLVESVVDDRDARLVGQRVAVASPVDCGQCAGCAAGRPWDCSDVTLIGVQHQGSNADYCVAPVDNIELLPEEMSFSEAAALSASGPLAMEELSQAELGSGDWVLIPGSAGAVGLTLVGLAARAGAHVIGLTRGGRGDATVRELGARHVLDAEREDLADAIRQAAPSGVNVVVDNVAQVDLFKRYLPAIARRGRIVTAGQTGGRAPLALDVLQVCQRRITISGVQMGDKRFWRTFWAEQRDVPMHLPSAAIAEFPLTEAAEAHQAVERRGRTGSVVLTVRE